MSHHHHYQEEGNYYDSNGPEHTQQDYYHPADDWQQPPQPPHHDQQRQRTPVSPISATTSLTSSLWHSQPIVDVGQLRIPPSKRSVSPLKERFYAMPPAPWNGQQSNSPAASSGQYEYPQQRIPSQQKPYMPTASDFSPPDPERRALNDIDNLFGPRDVLTPSPTLLEQERSYGHHSIDVAAATAPPREKKRRQKSHHQPTGSASSTVPLMSTTSSQHQRNQSPSPSRKHRNEFSTVAAAATTIPQRTYSQPQEHAYEQYDYDQTYPAAATPTRQNSRPNMHRHTDSAASNTPLMQQSPSPTKRGNSISVAHGAAPVGGIPRRWQGEDYDGFVDPNSLTDDDGDGFEDQRRGSKKSRGRLAGAGAAGVGAAAAGAAGTTAASKGGFKIFDRRGADDEEEASNFAPLYPNTTNNRSSDLEKSEWLDKQSTGSKRLKWIVGSLLLFVILAAVVGGTTGGILGMKKDSPSNGSTTSPSSSSKNGLYDIHSPEVRALLNNTALHKVFPGMDYTPQNAQYPACLSNPLKQNDITLDVAQLAQLTPSIRLYGTDCDQTEMVLNAISLLNYNATLQVWLGVWLGPNSTTNARQLSQMEDILKAWPREHFAGVIVGNEVLFREDLTEPQLAGNLTSVRSSLSALGITDLPVATSDLGDDWTTQLAGDSDIVMANVHPFFAGVTPREAPGWTWEFWQGHNVGLKQSEDDKTWPTSIIAEVGWPSEGGENCGGATGACSSGEEGAVASVEGMNEFMEGWVCESLRNGTAYFW
jgi:exo-beta-1,3-glucanase (GH17 family)